MSLKTESDRFYTARDRRTKDYLDRDFPSRVPVTIHAGHESCTTQHGQLLLLTLANLLGRAHQQVHFALAVPNAPLRTKALCGATSLGDELLKLLARIDPYGSYAVEGLDLVPARISVGVGVDCRRDLRWYVGYDRSVAELNRSPLALGQGNSADLRGAGLAAIIAAATVFKDALKIETSPTRLSAWNFAYGDEAEAGSAEFPLIDVGRGLMIGAGAVAASASYWLMQWGNADTWVVVDGDIVKLHNTNRCLLFFPDDAGWIDGEARQKVACLCEHLPNATPIGKWYDETPVNEQQFDTVLVLANERNVRTLVSQRNDPVQLQATTGRSWLSQLHRHIVARDDCVRCRMADIKTPSFGCSEGQMETSDEPNRPDAALPFLSAASGLMLVSALQRLQLGELGDDVCNTWRWDFKTQHDMASMGRHRCRPDCTTLLASSARQTIAAQTRWSDQAWLNE